MRDMIPKKQKRPWKRPLRDDEMEAPPRMSDAEFNDMLKRLFDAIEDPSSVIIDNPNLDAPAFSDGMIEL